MTADVEAGSGVLEIQGDASFESIFEVIRHRSASIRLWELSSHAMAQPGAGLHVIGLIGLDPFGPR